MRKSMRIRGLPLLLAAVILVSCGDHAVSIATYTNPWADADTEPHTEPEEEYGYKIGEKLPDRMPVLSISTRSGEEIVSRTEYLPAQISLNEPLGKFNFDQKSADVRCRGNYTFYGDGIVRKSFRLKFEEKTDPLGLGNGKSKSWVLLANFVDRSMLRCYVAFAMAKKLNFGFSSDAAFVELYVNGDYRGVYLLCEHPSRNSRRIDIEENPDVLDSDYLIELDMRAHETGTVWVDYFESGGKQYVIKNDSPHPDALTFLAAFFDGMNQAIESGDRDEIEKYIDVDSFVDMYILQEYAMNVDVGWASLFFVKKASGKLSLTFPWDFDLAFGNYGIIGDAKWDVLYVGGDQFSQLANVSPMFRGLMDCDWFKNLVQSRFQEIGAVLRDLAFYEIDRIQEVYKDEFLKNYEKYPVLGKRFGPIPRSISKLSKYSDTVDQFRNWIARRYAFLLEEIG